MKQVIIILLCGAFLTRLFLYIAYERVLRIAYDVSNSNHELIKQIKLRYTNCNTLNIPIMNISAFIKKHILLNCGFKRIVPYVDVAGYIMLIISLVLTNIYYGSNLSFEEQLVIDSNMQMPLITLLILLTLFILLNGIIKGEEKLNQATVLIADYLENVLSHRNINKREKISIRRNCEQQKNAETVDEEKVSIDEQNNCNHRDNKNNDIDNSFEHGRKEDVAFNAQKEELKDSEEYIKSISENTIGKLINSAVDTKHAEKIINEVLKEYLA